MTMRAVWEKRDALEDVKFAASDLTDAALALHKIEQYALSQQLAKAAGIAEDVANHLRAQLESERARD